MRIKNFGLVLIPAAMISACGMSDTIVTPVVAAEMPAQEAVYRSTKKVSTVCPVKDITLPPPGFAEPLGAELRTMPPPMAAMMAVGADREPIETDWDRVSPGYTLVEPLTGWDSYLINNEKEVVGTIKGHRDLEFTRFLPDGNRYVSSHGRTTTFNPGGGAGGGRRGCIEEYSADGKLLWRLGLTTENYIQHHDAVKLPNGNILMLVWENEPASHPISQGRNPELIAESGNIWYDGIIEVNPYTAEIVWEWSTRHHLIQDFDSTRPNYGVVADHPELLDINAVNADDDGSVDADWIHANAMDYNAELDQIIFSSNYLSEVYIIDHSTTPWEAAGHTGGRYGRGGDFLYRWGNPQQYDRGTADDRKLHHQHNIQWIKDGLPGAGNFLVFNNGSEQRPFSTVTEFVPEMNQDGTYVLEDGKPYGPEALVWEYNPAPPERFFSFFISGAQRMENGNTLITQGAGGMIREVTVDGEIVWDYAYKTDVDAPQMLFRGNRFPIDHPALVNILNQ